MISVLDTAWKAKTVLFGMHFPVRFACNFLLDLPLAFDSDRASNGIGVDVITASEGEPTGFENTPDNGLLVGIGSKEEIEIKELAHEKEQNSITAIDP